MAIKKATIIVTLEVDLADLPMTELRENAKLGDCKVSDLPRLADVQAGEVASSIAGAVEHYEETFAGSDMHIQITGVRLAKAAWK